MTVTATRTRTLPATRAEVPDMPFEVTHISYLETHNGLAYVADVTYAGERVGTFENDGNGGATMPRLSGNAAKVWREFVGQFTDDLFHTSPEIRTCMGLRENNRLFTEEWAILVLLSEWETRATLDQDIDGFFVLPGMSEVVDVAENLRVLRVDNKLLARAAMDNNGGGLLWDPVQGCWAEVG